jgi:LPS sulfotransferase NodH
MDERKNRIGDHSIDENFEQVLLKANIQLQNIDQDLYIENGYLAPLVVICFTPRSGSTLLAQYLASTGDFNYFSGFNARFWEAPVFSQLLESKLGLRNELKEISQNQFSSNYGYTPINSFPHEFGFFWNQFLTSDNHYIDSNELSDAKKSKLKNVVNSCRRLSNKPFVIKNGITAYNAKLFKELFPDVKFIHLHRDPEAVVQSIYQARKNLYGDSKTWWSLVPKEQKQILNQAESSLEEIVLQVKHIENAFKPILDKSNSIDLSYASFCEDPGHQIKRIYDLFNLKKDVFTKFDGFDVRNKITLQPSEKQELQVLLKKHNY